MARRDIIEELEEIGLSKPKPKRYFRSSLTSGKTNKKRPYKVARKWFGVLLLEHLRFEGRSTVKVSDESAGYSKVLVSATGLDQFEADMMYEETADKLKSLQGGTSGKS